MSDEPEIPARRTLKTVLLGGTLLVAIFAAALVARLLSVPPQAPSHQTPSERQARPIVQIVRQQPGLPDLSDLIDRICPSVAMIVPHGSDVTGGSGRTPSVTASSYSADGWLVTSADDLPPMPLDAIFSDGRRTALTDVRTDPVSGLALVKGDAAATPLSFSDQAFPRVGQFGVALITPAGRGCSAATSMIGSDFLADGGSAIGYVRLDQLPDGWAAGMPLLGPDGRVLGIGTSGPPGALIPAPIASVILDELIRNSLSASTNFGFRAVDYAAPFSSRLGDVRSGAGIALVQPKSSAARAGLEAGDIVIAVDDSPVSSASELGRLLDSSSSKAILTIQRGAKQLHLTVRRSSGQ